MGAACCRCHHQAALDDVPLLHRHPSPPPPPRASTRRSRLQRRAMSLNARLSASPSSSSSSPSPDARREPPPPPPPPPPPRMLSQALANYIAFPFPFAKKVRARQPGRSRSSPAIAGDRKPSAAVTRRASTGSVSSKKKAPLPALLLAGYVGDHWRKTPRGTFVPLSLVDCCVRSICMRLLHDPDAALQATHDNDDDDDEENEEKGGTQRVLALPAEIAAAILAWLKQHQQLEKEQFQLLAPILVHEWNLSGCEEVDASWFDGVPFGSLQQLRSIDVSGCHQLEDIVGVRRGSNASSTDTFPSLMVARFRGCAKLSPSVVDLLQFSPFLVSLDLSGCRNVDDRNLLALRRLHALETLNLSGCRLVTDTGVSHLAGLHKLKKLVLGHCQKLTGAAFSTFASSYAELRYLDIAYCRVCDESLRHIGEMRSLETLILRGCNDITDAGLSSLAGLESLRYFDVRHCEEIRALPTTWSELRVLLLARTAFGEADAAVLQHMLALEELDVRTCRILKRGIDFICRLKHLERLVLAETALTDAGLLEICTHLKYLKALDISGTEVTDLGTTGLIGLKDLEILYMDTPGITNRTLANLTALPRLEKLDLFGASITDNGLLHLVPLRRLRELDICNGNISDRGAELISKITTLTSLNLSQNRNIHAKSLCFLRSLTELRYLNLSNTSISALSLRHLYPLKELETLSVYGCVLTSSHIDVLRDILPALRCLRCA